MIYFALAESFLGKCLNVPVQPLTTAESDKLGSFEIMGERAFISHAGPK
ncbi:MAG: hypothetical protein V4723_02980 [Pseudomonadota bacterium]